jgi:hypothetical protein
MLKTVKLSYPNWQEDLISFSPALSGIWGNYKFEINNDCKDCDYWVILDSYRVGSISQVKAGLVLLVTIEEVDIMTYPNDYLTQFDFIITSRQDINGKNVNKWHYLCPWHIKKNYDEIMINNSFTKTKDLSIICSDSTIINGHKKRYAFVNRLIGHFKDNVDVFGKGSNFIPDKYTGLAPYRYSVAIENSAIQDYFTEKISDCFLSNTVPIYYGCHNINKYFDSNSFLQIDIDDYKKSIKLIEQAIAENFYEKNINALISSKEKSLNDYQIFSSLSKILDIIPILNGKKSIKIYRMERFVKKKELIKAVRKLKIGLFDFVKELNT